MGTDTNRAPTHLPKDEARRPKRAPVNFPPDLTEATVSVVIELATPSPLTKPANATHAMRERARETWPKKQRADNLTEEQRQTKPRKGALKAKK